MNELTEHEMESVQDVGKPLTLTVRTPSKRFIEMAAWNIIEQCQNGDINPLELVVKCAAIEKMCELIRKGVQPQVLDELSKEKGKAIVLGAKVDQKEVGTKYDYSESIAWKRLSELEKNYSDKRKEVEKLAKDIPVGLEMNYPDPETGEQLIIKRAAKSSETSFAVTLEK